MAKKRQQPPPETKSSGAPLAVLAIGGVAVLALVGWAVTRSMQAPTPVTTPAAVETSAEPVTPAPIPSSTAPLIPPPTSSAPISTLPPAVSEHTQSPEKAAVPRIEAAVLKQQMASGAVTVIDVRDLVSYGNGHIPGAMHIPFARIEAETQYLPKDKPIVAYCT